MVVAAFDTIKDNSFLWHVTAGHLQSSAAEVLTIDPFSFTVRGEPWLTQSWLAELLYSVGESTFGIGFVGPMMVLVGLVAMFGIGLVAYRKSSSLLATVSVLLLGTLLLLPVLVPRPALFSYALFVLVILAWENPSTRWAIPFLMWLWASIHGTFAIGLVYLGVVAVSHRHWKAIPHLVAAGIATLLTAHGLGVASMLLDFAGAGPYLALVSEWATPDFLTWGLAPFLVSLVILVWGGIRQSLEPRHLWVIAACLALAMSATRAVAIAWIALTPVLALSLKGVSWRWGRGFPRAMAAALAIVILFVPFLLVSPVEIDAEIFPVAARTALSDVRTFHDDSAGGYLIFDERFTEGVFIDDRAELYLDRIEEFVEVRSGRRPWEPVFQRDGVEQALLKRGEPLIDRLTDAGWKTTYTDEYWMVLAPSSS
ncbi:MAG: hypothetical protein WD269_12445 [Acidimicrobiia bacterium]